MVWYAKISHPFLSLSLSLSLCLSTPWPQLLNETSFLLEALNNHLSSSLRSMHVAINWVFGVLKKILPEVIVPRGSAYHSKLCLSERYFSISRNTRNIQQVHWNKQLVCAVLVNSLSLERKTKDLCRVDFFCNKKNHLKKKNKLKGFRSLQHRWFSSNRVLLVKGR